MPPPPPPLAVPKNAAAAVAVPKHRVWGCVGEGEFFLVHCMTWAKRKGGGGGGKASLQMCEEEEEGVSSVQFMFLPLTPPQSIFSYFTDGVPRCSSFPVKCRQKKKESEKAKIMCLVCL